MRWLFACVLTVALWQVGHADDSMIAAPDVRAIEGVIEQQMQAFRKDDAAAAYAFASPGIQAQFGDAATFLDMVRRGYQPVYRPRSMAFGVIERRDGQVVQHVGVVGPDGAAREALYFMEREADGHWRIAGCVLTESHEVGA